MSTERMYDEPRYYDIAFGWDISREVDFLEEVFRKLATNEVHSVLDLACGTGRFALELARRGYQAAGLDLSREMLGFARERAANMGVPVELFLKDMSDFALFRTFDAAICMTGSLPYLTSLDSILSHLRQVGAHLGTGAVYVVDLAVVMDLAGVPFAPQEWTQERDRVKVTARWEVVGPYDPLGQLMKERLTLRGEERGWERVWEQETPVRLFFPQEFLAIVQASGCFRLAGWFSDFDLERRFDQEPLGNRMIAVLVKATRAAAPEPAAEGPARPAEGRRDWGGRGDRRDGRWGDRRRRDGRDGGGRSPRPHGQNGYGVAGGPGGSGRPDRRDGRTETEGPDAGGPPEAPEMAPAPAEVQGGAGGPPPVKKRRRRRPRGRKPGGGSTSGQGPGGPGQGEPGPAGPVEGVPPHEGPEDRGNTQPEGE